VSVVPSEDGNPRLIVIEGKPGRTGQVCLLDGMGLDAEDIDPQEDDGKMWVPVTAQSLKMDVAG